ncbi:hypothetical protein T06_8899 [Trichinella sp. T6]|nr:hypothetical protein T06_8899 [Trichinella sp. T6]
MFSLCVLTMAWLCEQVHFIGIVEKHLGKRSRSSTVPKCSQQWLSKRVCTFHIWTRFDDSKDSKRICYQLHSSYIDHFAATENRLQLNAALIFYL